MTLEPESDPRAMGSLLRSLANPDGVCGSGGAKGNGLIRTGAPAVIHVREDPCLQEDTLKHSGVTGRPAGKLLSKGSEK